MATVLEDSAAKHLLRSHDTFMGSFSVFISAFINSLSFCWCQNVLRGCSVLLGPSTSGLWRTLAQSQNHIPGGGPGVLTELLEQYAKNLAQNMKLTYLNPVALVAPNIGEFGLQMQTCRHNTIINHRSHPKIKRDSNEISIFANDMLQFSHNTVNRCCEISDNESL